MANIVVVGPHPDDQEAGMGGTIALLAAQGHRVLLLDMTNGEPTPLGDPATRAKEAAAAAAVLSAPGNPVTRRQIGLPNREVRHSLDARHKVAAAYREWRADVLFVPYFEDAHPDHVATTRIAEDARFDAKLTKTDIPGEPVYPKWLFHYYATHLRIAPNPTFCVDTSDHAEQKLRAIRAYETQFVRANAHVVDWIQASGVYFGSRIGTRAAEPFFSREPLGMRSLESLA